MRNKFVLSCFFVFCFMFLFLGANSFAAIDIENDILPLLPEEVAAPLYDAMSDTDKNGFSSGSYFCVTAADENYSYVTVLVSSSPMVFTLDGDYLVVSSDNFCRTVSYELLSSGYYYARSYNISSLSPSDVFLAANQNVVDSVSGKVFMTPPLTGILAPIVEEVETEKVLEEILGVLPIVLVIIVGLIGLRKALRMLSTLLRRS